MQENTNTCHECDEEESHNIYKIIISLILFSIGLIIKISIIKTILLITSFLIVGLEIIINAIKNLLKGELIEENFLMSTASIGAIAIGELPEAVAVMLFYQIGEYFQDKAVDKSKKHIKELMEIRPEFARVKRNNKEICISPEEVLKKEIIIVKPGEKVPLDGIVKKGESYLDTMAITGESVPVKVNKESKITSGTINLTSPIEIEVTNLFKESTISKILDLVENAKEKKSNKEDFITRFARIYTPIVVILAIIIAILPPLITNSPFKIWLYKSLSFLVISCPCALVISIPLSFMAGIGISAKHGILIKGSNYLEELNKINTIVFDKTGTLTEGTFKVRKINTVSLSKEELLEITSLAEYNSLHPIAKSIKEEYKKELNTDRIKSVKELSGLGIKAIIDNKEVLIGNSKLMDDNNITYKKEQETETTIYIAINHKYEGNIIISDKIKNNIKETINNLKTIYNIKTIMLTGDKIENAKHISETIKIDKYIGDLLPEEKAEYVETLKNNGERVLFVGDGINDAPVLTVADIGIGMGGIGSDAAIEASDIIIMEDDISKIIPALIIAKRTEAIAKFNIIFAITVKILILLLSILGLTTMWASVFADVGVSIIAILNSLRLLKLKIKE